MSGTVKLAERIRQYEERIRALERAIREAPHRQRWIDIPKAGPVRLIPL